MMFNIFNMLKRKYFSAISSAISIIVIVLFMLINHHNADDSRVNMDQTSYLFFPATLFLLDKKNCNNIVLSTTCSLIQELKSFKKSVISLFSISIFIGFLSAV